MPAGDPQRLSFWDAYTWRGGWWVEATVFVALLAGLLLMGRANAADWGTPDRWITTHEQALPAYVTAPQLQVRQPPAVPELKKPAPAASPTSTAPLTKAVDVGGRTVQLAMPPGVPRR